MTTDSSFRNISYDKKTTPGTSGSAIQSFILPDFLTVHTFSPSLCLSGGLYKGHVDILAPTVQELANLEREVQTSFLQLGYLPNQLFKAFWASLFTARALGLKDVEEVDSNTNSVFNA